MTTDIALYMVKRPIVVLLLVWFVLYIVRISLFSMKYWFKTKWTVSAFTSCHKERQVSVASVSLGRDLRQGKPAMNAVVPWQCNYSLISNKRKQIGGHSLVDEVNHMNCCLVFVVLSLDYLGYLRYPFMS